MFEIAGYSLQKILGILLILVGIAGTVLPNVLSLIKLKFSSPSVSVQGKEKSYAEQVADITGYRNDIAVFAMVNNLTVKQIENLMTFIDSLELKG